jgi:S-adenosylmethionine decarboxylase
MPKKVPSMPQFGYHFSLDGYECESRRLSDLDIAYQFLNYCPDRVQMMGIIPPHVFRYQGKVSADRGISGFVILKEPAVHISLHTFPDRRYISIDIFSAEEFNYHNAEEFAEELFKIGRLEASYIERKFSEKDPDGGPNPIHPGAGAAIRKTTQEFTDMRAELANRKISR